jgi:hypothetical protein
VHKVPLEAKLDVTVAWGKELTCGSGCLLYQSTVTFLFLGPRELAKSDKLIFVCVEMNAITTLGPTGLQVFFVCVGIVATTMFRVARAAERFVSRTYLNGNVGPARLFQTIETPRARKCQIMVLNPYPNYRMTTRRASENSTGLHLVLEKLDINFLHS